MPPRIFDYRHGQVGRPRRIRIYVEQRVDGEDRGIKHVEQLEKVIGYEFNDLTLAARALDLVGYYASDHEAPDSPSHRLAWEGDTMLDLVLKRAWRKLGIFSRHSGDKEKTRSLGNPRLAKIYDEVLKINYLIRKPGGNHYHGEPFNEHQKATVVEAIIGAVYIDSSQSHDMQMAIDKVDEIMRKLTIYPVLGPSVEEALALDKENEDPMEAQSVSASTNAFLLSEPTTPKHSSPLPSSLPVTPSSPTPLAEPTPNTTADHVVKSDTSRPLPRSSKSTASSDTIETPASIMVASSTTPAQTTGTSTEGRDRAAITKKKLADVETKYGDLESKVAAPTIGSKRPRMMEEEGDADGDAKRQK